MIYPAELDLEILQGATFYRQFIFRTQEDQAPIDLTGARLRMQARRNARAEAVLFEANTDDGTMVIEDAQGGVFAISLTAEQTDPLDFASAVYDIEVEMPDSGTHRLIEGGIFTRLQVTR